MKAWKLTPFLIGAILLFSYCQKETIEIHENSSAKAKYALQNDNCVVVQDLWAGGGQNDLTKGTKVGFVEARIAFPYLYVTYYTNGMWALTEAHLWVGTSLADIPRNAAPGRFPHKADINNLTEYEFKVDLEALGIDNDDLIYVAAHSVVRGQEFINLEDWLPKTAKVYFNYYSYNPDFNSYFHVDLSEAGFLNGLNFEGWCLDPDVFMNFGYNPYIAGVYNSISVLPADLVSNPDILPAINFLFNQDLGAYSIQDIQVAIWVLLDDELDEQFFLARTNFGINGFNWANVQFLVGLALDNLDFEPVCGEFFGVILVNDKQQTMIIKVPVPCAGKGEDTAWAFGEHTFIDNNIAKKWGWVFEVDLSLCD